MVPIKQSDRMSRLKQKERARVALSEARRLAHEGDKYVRAGGEMGMSNSAGARKGAINAYERVIRILLRN